jgi:hypothetical protein
MVKMEICSDPEDEQISKLNEASLITYKIRKAGRGMRLRFGKFKPSFGGGVKVFLPVSKENSFGTNGSSVSLALCSNKAPAAPNTLPSGSLLSNGKNADVALEDPATTNDLKGCRSPCRSVQATLVRSDGESSERCFQRSPPPNSHREVSTQIAKEAAGALGNSSHPKVLSKNSAPVPRILELFSVVASKGPSSEIPGVIAERQEARKEPPAARDKDPREITDPRRGSSTFSATPPNPALTTRPGTRPGSTAPTGADLQGPSPVDNNLELQVEFPIDMVIEMQGNAAKKTRRMVIGRTLGGERHLKPSTNA